ncbi:MAG: hypothetical protein HN948_07815 [Clostridia bacterium]|jgi:hypothetical protein|nr:hypothetical protein [Clostridia bacterium]MBT7122902.1 hypothetical protein [Clostridia bacterium]
MKKTMCVILIFIVVFSFFGCSNDGLEKFQEGFNDGLEEASEPTAEPTTGPTSKPTVVPQKDSIDFWENRVQYLLFNDKDFMDKIYSINEEGILVHEAIADAKESNDLFLLPELYERGIEYTVKYYDLTPVTTIGKEYKEMIVEHAEVMIAIYTAKGNGDVELETKLSDEASALSQETRDWLRTK